MAESRRPAQGLGGSTTQVVEEEGKQEENQAEGVSSSAPTLTLRLRARPRVTWGADVVNNENMGKKSSKRCCIFHKRREFGESSSDESDSDMDDEAREKRWAQHKPGRPKPHQMYHA
ncbi:unnamed protein product [Discosporangium mesarthrocarpum]